MTRTSSMVSEVGRREPHLPPGMVDGSDQLFATGSISGGCGLDMLEGGLRTTYVVLEGGHILAHIRQVDRHRSEWLRNGLLEGLLLVGFDLLPQDLDAVIEYLLPVGLDLQLSETC